MHLPSYRYANPEHWREFLEDKRDKACAHKSLPSLGEFTPLLTDGVIVEARQHHSGKLILVHLADISWPAKDRKTSEPKAERAPAPPRPRKAKELSLSDLL